MSRLWYNSYRIEEYRIMWGCGTEILSVAVAEVVGVSDKGGQRRRYQPRIPDCPPPPHSNATGIRAIIWIRAGGSGWAVERQAAEVFRHAHARTGAGGGDQPLLTLSLRSTTVRERVCEREREHRVTMTRPDPLFDIIRDQWLRTRWRCLLQ